LRANGSSIGVEVNGATVIGPVTNTAFTSGNAGVWSYAPGRHRFDNFTITVPSASLRTWLGGGVYRKVKVLAMTDARRWTVVNPLPANTTWRVNLLTHHSQPIRYRRSITMGVSSTRSPS
jgi:hypothetical protein